MASPDVFYIMTEKDLSTLYGLMNHVDPDRETVGHDIIDRILESKLDLGEVPGTKPKCMDPDGAEPCKAYAELYAAALLNKRLVDAIEKQVRNPEDIVALASFLVFAEDENQRWGGFRATEALEALCRMINLPIEQIREKMKNPEC